MVILTYFFSFLILHVSQLEEFLTHNGDTKALSIILEIGNISQPVGKLS